LNLNQKAKSEEQAEKIVELSLTQGIKIVYPSKEF